jgi:putative endonuclease
MRWPFRTRPLPFGRAAEIRGAAYLRSQGYLLLACPYRARGGEIDIVCEDRGTLVFVEVKARRNDEHPEDAVNVRKQSRLIHAARSYRRQHRSRIPYRYDILAVLEAEDGELAFRLFRDAFRESSTVAS